MSTVAETAHKAGTLVTSGDGLPLLRLRAGLDQESTIDRIFNRVGEALGVVDAVTKYISDEGVQAKNSHLLTDFNIDPMVRVIDSMTMYAGIYQKGMLGMSQDIVQSKLYQLVGIDDAAQKDSDFSHLDQFQRETIEFVNTAYATGNNFSVEQLQQVEEFAERILQYNLDQAKKYYGDVLPGIWEEYESTARDIVIGDVSGDNMMYLLALFDSFSHIAKMAHDVKNPTTALRLNQQMLRRQKGPSGSDTTREKSYRERILAAMVKMRQQYEIGIDNLLRAQELVELPASEAGDVLYALVMGAIGDDTSFQVERGQSVPAIDKKLILPDHYMGSLVECVLANLATITEGKSYQPNLTLSTDYVDPEGKPCDPRGAVALDIYLDTDTGGWLPGTLRKGFSTDPDAHGYRDNSEADSRSTGRGLSDHRAWIEKVGGALFPVNIEDLILPEEPDRLPIPRYTTRMVLRLPLLS